MNSQGGIQISAYIVVAISLALIMLDHPTTLHYRPLRFFYRFGLLLYSHVFKVSPQSNKSNIPQWKMEHWMSISGSSTPRAEEDGEGRYILMEFVAPLFQPIPLLMRAKISWDNKENKVIVRGYTTWTYFVILIFLVVLCFIPKNGNENLCFSVPLLIYLLWCSILYLGQAQRLHSIGTKVAEYLSVN